jgi:hypothetical protein
MIKSRWMKWSGHVARTARKNDCIYDFGGKEEKRLLGRHRRRRKDNIKMDVEEIEWVFGFDYSGSGGLL